VRIKVLYSFDTTVLRQVSLQRQPADQAAINLLVGLCRCVS
jgi:hypothetical protein